jgi:hypothetical protein
VEPSGRLQTQGSPLQATFRRTVRTLAMILQDDLAPAL